MRTAVDMPEKIGGIFTDATGERMTCRKTGFANSVSDTLPQTRNVDALSRGAEEVRLKIMKPIDTGTRSANQLLNTIIARGLCIAGADGDAWLRGDLQVFMNYRFLALHSKLAADQVTTVLAHLITVGIMSATVSPKSKAGAVITLRLPAGATIA